MKIEVIKKKTGADLYKNIEYIFTAYLRRGLAYQSLKKLELALKDFTAVVEIEPKNQRGKVK